MKGRAASYSIRGKRNATEPLQGAHHQFACVVGMGDSLDKFHDELVRYVKYIVHKSR